MKSHSDLSIDIRKGQFSVTLLQEYLDCPRKFYLRYGMSFGHKQSNLDQHFGSCIHNGIGTWYATAKNKLAALRAYAVEWEKNPLAGSEKKSMEIGLILLDHYFQVYQQDNTEYLPDMIETDFAMPMSNGTTLLGIIDRVKKQGANLTIVDTKTTGSPITDWYFKKYDNDFQTSGYLYVVEQLLKADCTIEIDAIKTPYKDDTCFQRRGFYRSELQRQEWLNTYYRVTDNIMRMLSEPEDKILAGFYQNQNSCSDYGGCKYLPLCQHGLDHPALKDEFVATKTVE